MSIKRIESAYAYYLDKKMSSAQMAVLQALAYSANEKNNEACYPSLARLAELTHLSGSTVERACKDLRAMNAISWKRGGRFDGLNIANIYTFVFPHTKMLSQSERYDSVLSKMERFHHDDAPVPSPCTPGTFTVREGYPRGEGSVPSQSVSNTEYSRNVNTELNAESKSEGLPHPSFDIGSVLKCVSGGKSRDPRMTNSDIEAAVYDREHSSPVLAAMRVCGVTDAENNRTFSNIAIWRDKNALFNVIERFWGEIKAGEHDDLKNRAAELTRRMMAVPKTQAAERSG